MGKGWGEESYSRRWGCFTLISKPSGSCCCTQTHLLMGAVSIRPQKAKRGGKKKFRLETNKSSLALEALKALIIESWTFNGYDRLVQPYQYLDNFPAKQASVTVWGRDGHFQRRSSPHGKKNIFMCGYVQKNPPQKTPYLQLGRIEEQKDRQTLLVFFFKSSRHQFRQQSGYSALKFYILFLMQTKLGALKIDAAT